MIDGSCLCGRVRFAVDGADGPFELCHCRRCRKSSGSVFVAGLGIDASQLHWLAGKDLVSSYAAPLLRHPPPYRKWFCTICASPLPSVAATESFAEVPAGVLDGDPDRRPDRHIFVELCPTWSAITDDLPQLDAAALRALRLGKTAGTRVIVSPSPPPLASHVLHGSCLCGGVGFEVRGGVSRMVCCHCSRCRKASGSAFGVTAVVDRDSFAYVRGEELIASLRSSAPVDRCFCRTCGSHLPLRQDPLVGVPAGLLDDDPGPRPSVHIFTASKAPWWSIDAAAPQYREGPPI